MRPRSGESSNAVQVAVAKSGRVVSVSIATTW